MRNFREICGNTDCKQLLLVKQFRARGCSFDALNLDGAQGAILLELQRKLHWPAANLTVFDVTRFPAGEVNMRFEPFTTPRALNGDELFQQQARHALSGLVHRLEPIKAVDAARLEVREIASEGLELFGLALLHAWILRSLPTVRIGPYIIDPPVILAPMAGVTDRPFRALCRRLGAGLAVSEMTTSDPALFDTEKSRLRRDHAGERGPIAVQIAGSDPAAMAECARYNVEHGAQIIDINMGCPAKKVCRADAGSALLRDPQLVRSICRAVASAVFVPVTLKIRTGYTRAARNGVDGAGQECHSGRQEQIAHSLKSLSAMNV